MDEPPIHGVRNKKNAPEPCGSEALFAIRTTLRGNGDLFVILRIHADLVGLRALVLELHHAIDEGEDGVIAAEADVIARVILGAVLADDDVAGDYLLAAVLLDAEEFRVAVAPVA